MIGTRVTLTVGSGRDEFRESLISIKAPVVEEWLQNLKFDKTWRQKNTVGLDRKVKEKEKDMQLLAPASKAQIRDLMCVLFNHAIRWEFADRNPISARTRGWCSPGFEARQRIPEILEVSEMQAIVARLHFGSGSCFFSSWRPGCVVANWPVSSGAISTLQIWISMCGGRSWIKWSDGARRRHRKSASL